MSKSFTRNKHHTYQTLRSTTIDTQPTAEQQIESLNQQLAQTSHQLLAANKQAKLLSDNYDALSNALQGVQIGQAQAAAEAEAKELAEAEALLAAAKKESTEDNDNV